MELFTTAMLNTLLTHSKRQAEELMPEIIKRLINHSTTCISKLRMPSGNDIWAPGYDGVVKCDLTTKYVPEGISVWEIGTSDNSLKKVNADYAKRTNEPLRDIAFSIQKYKHEDLYPYLDTIRKWIEVTTSEEPIIGIAWMFLNSYSLPAEELLIEDEYDFTRITNRKEEIRLSALSTIQEENFENSIELLVTILKDETGWGIFLSKIAVDESMRDIIYKSLSLHKKYNILAGFLDHVSLEYFERKISLPQKNTAVSR